MTKLSELKPGDWFEYRGNSASRGLYAGRDGRGGRHVFAMMVGGSVELRRSRSDDDVTPLPACTGWDWQPPEPELQVEAGELQVRNGAYYERRDGEVVGPAMQEPAAARSAFHNWRVGNCYYGDCGHGMSDRHEWFGDLIREVPPPTVHNQPSKEWLAAMAEKEGGKCVSVGGLAVELGMYKEPSPTSEPDPGEGWRLIDTAEDEPRDGDEYWDSRQRNWLPRLAPTSDWFLKRLTYYRRRIEPTSEPEQYRATSDDWHEIADRTHIAISLISDHIEEHQAIKGTPLQDRVSEVISQLAELYQEFGSRMTTPCGVKL